MKILYFGGQKSGKSNAAAQAAIALAKTKPYYVATYDNSYCDSAMDDRVAKHQVQRKDDFITIEEPLNLTRVIKPGKTYLVDCLSMWLFNNLEHDETELVSQLEKVLNLDSNIIFVINDVGRGVIPMDSQSRRFVDLSGIIGQYVAGHCDEVHRVEFGITQKIK